MEVHHVKTPRQKWSHYLFEFLMLFTAVTAGFLAENLREHRIELKREKKLMYSLLHDLEADIYQIDSLKRRRKSRNDSCDILIRILTNPVSARENGAAIYFHGRNASRRIHFRPHDGTLQQIRNSSGFRVVHDLAVLNDINAYELQLKANLENIEVEEKELSEYSQMAGKLFDVKVFQEMTKNNTVERPAGNPLLLSYDRALLNELGIKLHYWKRTSLSELERLEILKITAVRLIVSIREEYHLK